MPPVTAAQIGPQVDDVKEAGGGQSCRNTSRGRGSAGSRPRSRSRRSTGELPVSAAYCPSSPRPAAAAPAAAQAASATLRPRPKAEAVPLSPTSPYRHTAGCPSTQPSAAASPEMSYLPAGSAVTDVQGGRVTRSGRHRRPRRPAGALIRPALALATVAAAGLIAAALALPAEESQRTIRFLEIARSTHARLIDHNGNRQPDMGDSIAAASDLFRWHGSRRGARLGHLWRVCIFATTSTGTAPRPSSCRTGRCASWATWTSTAPGRARGRRRTGAYLGIRGSFTSQPLGKRTSTRSSDLVHLLR